MRSKFVLSTLFAVLLVSLCWAKGNKTLLVADRTIACAGTFECIQIKEKASVPWRNYSDTIEGFNYEEGYEYKISVQPLQTKNTLSGLFEEKYKLVKVISKKKTSYNPAEKLTGKKWVLRSMYDTNRTMTVHDTTAYIEFDLKAGKASGHAVCNTFTTEFTADAKSISITNIGQTKMACKGEVLEKIIFDFCRKATTYTLADGMLTLLQPGGSNLVFEAR